MNEICQSKVCPFFSRPSPVCFAGTGRLGLRPNPAAGSFQSTWSNRIGSGCYLNKTDGEFKQYSWGVPADFAPIDVDHRGHLFHPPGLEHHGPIKLNSRPIAIVDDAVSNSGDSISVIVSVTTGASTSPVACTARQQLPANRLDAAHSVA